MVFHSFAMFLFIFLLNSSISITETLTYYIFVQCTYFITVLLACIHILLLACAQCCYIFVNPFTSCVTDRYQLQQDIIMETETETNNKNICSPGYVHNVVIFLLTLLLLVLLIVISQNNAL